MPEARLLYCRCAYAQVLPGAVKDGVLEGLCASGRPFAAVADLCEMAARKDPALAGHFGGGGPVKVAACHPRAVRWLLRSAGVEVVPPEEGGPEVVNLREESVESALDALLPDRNGGGDG